MPGIFGVFFYRSANPRTLDALQGFPAGAGRRAHARVRGGRDAGGRLRAHDSHADGRRRAAISTSATCRSARAQQVLASILERVGVDRMRMAGRQDGGRRDWCGQDVVWQGRCLASAAICLARSSAQTPLQRAPGARSCGRPRSINATWGIYVKSLETGEEIAIDADRQMETMSTIKIPLMVEVVRADQGRQVRADRQVHVRRRPTRSRAPARSSGSTPAR